MTEFTGDGLYIDPQDLSTISPDGEDDDRMFHHNGASSISTVGGGTNSTRGYYVWDADAGAWFTLFRDADTIDGKDAGDFLHRDGSLAMQAALDVGNYGIVNLGEASGGTGEINLNTNHVEVQSNSAGANIRLLDNNSLLIAEAIEGGHFDIPNGELREGGARVATRTWTNTNADVPNADYADNAGTVEGYQPSDFLAVAGDQMEGTLDVGGFNINDGGSAIYDATAGEFVQSSLAGPASSLTSYPLPNGDLLNSAVTVTAGNQLTGGGTISLGGSVTVDVNDGPSSGLDADTLDGSQLSDLVSQFVDAAGDSMSGVLTLSDGSTAASQSWVENTAVANEADQIDGYDIQKNGTDGAGVINFKT